MLDTLSFSENCKKSVPAVGLHQAQELVVLAITRNIHALHQMLSVIDTSARSTRSWFPQAFGQNDQYTFDSLKKVVKHLEENTMHALIPGWNGLIMLAQHYKLRIFALITWQQ